METQIKKYEEQSPIIIEEANKLEIKTGLDMENASDKLKWVKDAIKKISEEKKLFTKPARDITMNARRIFKPLEDNFESAKMIIDTKMKVFDKEQEKKMAKKQAKIEEKINSGKINIEDATKKMKEAEAQKSYAGSSSNTTFKNVRVPVITNLNKLPRKYLLPNSTLIRKSLFAGIRIPGAELRAEKQINSS